MPPQPQKQDTAGNPAATPRGMQNGEDAGTSKKQKGSIGSVVVTILLIGIIIGGILAWFIFRSENQIDDETYGAVPAAKSVIVSPVAGASTDPAVRPG